ncbi:MAG: PD-(D/E)XK nuclease family protein, partial [Acidimicrobiaceae bacterium]|nr:PD-(D/E)XK nuclease family protein [Acidimicrobiaceae bacterium]
AHERLRLLYVACTRARDHLVVSLHRRDPGETGKKENSAAWALADAGAAGAEAVDGSTFLGPADEGEVPADGRPAPAEPPRASLPERDEWEHERDRCLARAAVPLAVSPTALSAAGGGAAIDDPGLDKDPDDSEQPPWSKGRYGTAIGRAVHGVLQDVDLATGEGLEALADRQAAAEGVGGRSRIVAGLARAALDTAVAREAAASQHWRELFVAAPFGERLVEGYVDLVYRGVDGLVVVDWKTDRLAGDDGVDAKLARYRLQGAAYAAALEAVTGEPVARMVFVFLDRAGAIEAELPDLPTAVDEAKAAAAGLSG